AGAPQQILKLRVYIYNKSFARRCAERRLQIGNYARNGLPPKGISEEQHKRLFAEDVIDDIHAMQMECRALLGCRAILLDILFCDLVQMRGEFDADNLCKRELRRHEQHSPFTRSHINKCERIRLQRNRVENFVNERSSRRRVEMSRWLLVAPKEGCCRICAETCIEGFSPLLNVRSDALEHVEDRPKQ